MPIVEDYPGSGGRINTLTIANADGTDIPLMSASRRITQALGFIGIATLRDNTRPRPQAHGAINRTRWEDGKIMVVEGYVRESTHEATDTTFRQMLAAMIETLDHGPAVLKWTVGASGLALQRTVRIAGPVDPVMEQDGTTILRYQAQFHAEDPRAYSQTLTTATGEALSTATGGKTYPRTYPRTYSQSSGGIATFTNSGTRPTPPILRVYGRIVDPQIVLIGSGQRIALSGTVEAGHYLELNVADRTVKLDGLTSQLNFLDAANTTWMEAPVGTSSWQLIATDFDGSARLDVIGRSAY